jgi:hypothetical protein
MQKTTIFLTLTLFLLAIPAAAQPQLDKLSLNIRLQAHRGHPEWRWTPTVDFTILGKMSDSAAITIEYTNPAGKSFVKLECADNGNSYDETSDVMDCGNNLDAASSTNLTGVFGFKIMLTDELNGINSTLYSGRFTVDKYLYNPVKSPAFNKNFYYFVNYDWRLATAAIGVRKTEYTPFHLSAWVWVKAERTQPDGMAYLFYNGKKIGESSYGVDMSYGTEENDAVEFSLLRFDFKTIFSPSESNSTWWKLYENPGEYEVKVLRKGELTRVFKFSIGQDGKIIQSNFGKELVSGSIRSISPVTMSGTVDGPVNQTILKSGWWGNQISGVTQ